jgi:acetyl esterase/lipase
MIVFDKLSAAIWIVKVHATRLTRPANALRTALAFVVAVAPTIAATLPSVAIAQTPNQVGFWYKPAEPGWGVSIQQQGTKTFAVWFTFDAQSKPIWHTLDCTFSNNVCAGDLYTGRGTPFAQIIGSANLVAVKSGTGSITLAGNRKMSLSYTIGGTSQTKLDLEPQDFASIADVPLCTLQAGSRTTATNYTDHWWGGSAQSGWGLQISHQGNAVFFGWYSYNDQGTATWNTGIGEAEVTNPNRFTGTIYQIPTGVPFSGTFSGTLPPTVAIGTFALSFSNGETGAFTYTLPSYGVTDRSLQLVRFALAGGATNLCKKVSPPQAIPLPEGDITPGTTAPLCAANTPLTLSYVNAGAPAQKLDLYLPPTGAAPFPTVIWIHGGGWSIGDKADVGVAKRLVCRGYAVASINYRLSGAAKFPAQIYDVKAAIRYLRANAAAYNLDANRFASFGSSAGGHLASLAGTSGGVADLEDLSLGNANFSSSVQAAVAWYGPSDFAKMDAQLLAQGCSANSATHGGRDSPESNLLGCTVSEPACASAILRANPATYVNAGTPPMLFMHGTQDCTVPNGQSTVMKTAMDTFARCSAKRNVLGAAHGGLAWDTVPVQDAVSAFLDIVLARASPYTCVSTRE